MYGDNLMAVLNGEAGAITEESVWQAIADDNGLDYDEIADGDLCEWL